ETAAPSGMRIRGERAAAIGAPAPPRRISRSATSGTRTVSVPARTVAVAGDRQYLAFEPQMGHFNFIAGSGRLLARVRRLAGDGRRALGDLPQPLEASLELGAALLSALEPLPLRVHRSADLAQPVLGLVPGAPRHLAGAALRVGQL